MARYEVYVVCGTGKTPVQEHRAYFETQKAATNFVHTFFQDAKNRAIEIYGVQIHKELSDDEYLKMLGPKLKQQEFWRTRNDPA